MGIERRDSIRQVSVVYEYLDGNPLIQMSDRLLGEIMSSPFG